MGSVKDRIKYRIKDDIMNDHIMNDHIEGLMRAIRQTSNNGMHDGLGNPTINVRLYQNSALKACLAIEQLQKCKESIRKHRDEFPDEPLEGERELWSTLDE